MNLIKIGDHRINADHILSIETDPNVPNKVVVWGSGVDNRIAILNGEDAHALLNWWDRRACNVLQEYQHDSR